MNKVIEKPHLLYLPFCIIIYIISKFWFGGITINVKDSYYVISHHDLALLISILFGIIGFIYWIFHYFFGNLSKRLNLIHIAITFGGLFLLLILNELKIESYDVDILSKYEFNQNLEIILQIITVIIILIQLIFPVNIIIGIIKTYKTVANNV